MISRFWDKHYQLDTETSELHAAEVFRLYQGSQWDTGLQLDEFIKHSNSILDLNKVLRSQQLKYKAKPITVESIAHHGSSNTNNDTQDVLGHGVLVVQIWNGNEDNPVTNKPTAPDHLKHQETFSKTDSNIIWDQPKGTHFKNKHLSSKRGKDDRCANISTFISVNYKITEGNMILADSLFHSYQQAKQNKGETKDEFSNILRTIHKPKTVTVQCKKTMFWNLKPVTSHSNTFHRDHPNNTEKIINDDNTITTTNNTTTTTNTNNNNNNNKNNNNNNIDIILANMQGIITKKKNKCKFIRDVTKITNPSQIIALTETWASDNFDTEFQRHFKDYNMMRADRKEPENKEDPKALSKGG